MAAFVALIAVLAAFAPNFLTPYNLLNVLEQVSIFAIIAWPMTLVIIAGEIDISVGSAVAFDGTLLAVLVYLHHWPLLGGIVAVLGFGLLVGLGAGWLRAVLNIPSFIVTLALYAGLRGGALLLTNSVVYPLADANFEFLGSGRVGGVPMPALIMGVLFVVFWFIATNTVYGRWIYAVGGNSQVARLSGINVTRVRISVFGLTGVFAALAAVLLAAALGAGSPQVAQGLEFSVISGVIVGGTSIFGGRGSMVGTAIGLLLIAFLQDGLVLLGINQYAQGVTQGAVILVAVVVTAMQASLANRGAAWRVSRSVAKSLAAVTELGRGPSQAEDERGRGPS